jgi:radical SAM superfamily enzyme YgiQ (UPF0313 family)
MLDLLLIHPDYPWPNKYPPMGILSLAGFLEREGYRVKVVDLAVTDGDPLEIVRQEIPKVVGISFMTPQTTAAYRLADAIRRSFPEPLLVAGGVHASALPAETLSHFDFAVVGEGEITTSELLGHVLKGRGRIEEIRGVALRTAGDAVVNRPRPVIRDMDDLPFPAWRHLPVERYRGLGMGLDPEKPFMVVLSSRGCPGRCIFCASHIVHGRGFRMRSAEAMAAEVRFLKERFGIEQFDFADDTMTVSKKRMVHFCEILIRERLSVSWDCNARVNTVDERMLALMKAAGCVRINFGVESGSQEILDRIGKGITLEQIRKAHRMAREAGLLTMSFFMLGHPGEDRNHVDCTLRLAREIAPDCPGLTFATPFPGTELFEIAGRAGWLDNRPWDRYTTTITGKDFLPVMRNGAMSREELLAAYRSTLDSMKMHRARQSG